MGLFNGAPPRHRAECHHGGGHMTRSSLTLLPATVLGAVTFPPPPAEVTRPDGLPAWTFNIPDPAEQPRAFRPEGIVRVPGSSREYDAAKIAGNANPPDWFPDEHPPAPKSVGGGTGITFACGSCHLMSGQGH